MTRAYIRAARALLFLLFFSAPLAAQAGRVPPGADTVVVAGERYEANGVQRLFLGSDYRDVWTAPVRVPVLDLDAYAGGLTPVRRGGGLQTIALRLKGADGCEYNFRSVDKELTLALPPDAQETLVDWARQDQTSAQLPAAQLVVAPLLEAAGVLHVKPGLYVMPDDPRLGRYRETFAGMLGAIELHPDEAEDGCPSFAGAERVAGTDRLLEHIEESPEHRVEARAYLAARLVDILVGDWDRHEGNWRWARFDRGGVHWWHPVPEDRDYAFVDYDGLILTAAQGMLNRLVRFEERGVNVVGLQANSAELNQWLLAPLSGAAWDSVAAAVQARITDEVIESAVRELPPEYHALVGEKLARNLKARRDLLREAAADYYLLLAQEPEVHATDEAERLLVERLPDGRVEVSISLLEGGEPHYRRVFDPRETSEVRIFLHGGDDVALVRGSGPAQVGVRILGGGGDDVLEDRSRGGVALYDWRGENRFVRGAGTKVVREEDYAEREEERARARAEEEAEEAGEEDEILTEEIREQQRRGELLPVRRRNWGGSRSLFTPWGGWVSNVGPVVGGGPSITRYGFRREPYHYQLGARVIVAPLDQRFGVEALADVRMENSPAHLSFRAAATDVSVARFGGFGNDRPLLGEEDTKVWQRQLVLESTYHTPLARGLSLSVGPVAQYTDPEVEGTPAELLRPLGSDPFGQLGGRAEVEWDVRDSAVYPRRGLLLRVESAAYPVVWEAEGPFGTSRAEANAFLSLRGERAPTLALRAGGIRAWGDFPFQEAARLGGSGTLRGYRSGSFLGDAALYGGAEVRAPLTRAKLVVRGTLGALALADAGRVYVDGESPGGWNTAYGGGMWFSFLDHRYTVSAVYARGDQSSVYLHLGFPF